MAAAVSGEIGLGGLERGPSECLMACILHVADSDSCSHLCCSLLLRHTQPSLHLHLLRTLTARHSQTPAPCCSSESLGDKRSWVLTMPVILWRRWGAVSLYSANPITGLLFACVSTHCNLKATPGPLSDTKWTACQTTGTPPKWIKVGYSGLSWPWGDVHTGFSSWRDKLNTVFYYRVTVKSVMYVNPSGIGKRRTGFLKGQNDGVKREGERKDERERRHRGEGNWFKRDSEGDHSEEKETLRKW